MKILKVLFIVLLFTACEKNEPISVDRNFSFYSDSSNVFGILSNSQIVLPNIQYTLRINESITFDKPYNGNVNYFKLVVFVDGVTYSLNNDYFFVIK